MASKREIYDVIVVGAGIEGSSTAYHLAKRGKHVLLLEQFPLPHNRGSSHGQSRITRKGYGAKDYYTKMMFESYRLTEELERECGEKLFNNCGCLMFGPRGTSFVDETSKGLQRHNVPHEIFEVEEQRRRYPNMSFPENFLYVLDKSGGTLRADKMLQAFQSLFLRFGGDLKDGEPMVDLIPGTTVSVKTSKHEYMANSVVLALGPWASKFLPKIGINVPLKPLKITVCYWKERNANTFEVTNFPTFICEHALGDTSIYGLPADEYPGLVKICMHHGPVIDPDQRDNVNNEWVLQKIKKVTATHFPTLEKEPSIVETCIYTMTPDEDFILDVHPKWKNVIIGAGFSGHGFKLSPIVGKVLAELAVGQTPTTDMAPFKIDRFFKNKL